MSTIHSYRPYDYRRVCDICGVLKNRSQLHRQGPYIICDEHAGERTRDELSRLNARAKQFRILPVPNPKPQSYTGPDVYQADEAEIFNFILTTTPYVTRDITSGAGMVTIPQHVLSAAWAAIYYADIVNEAKRPTAWINTARDMVRTSMIFVLAHQNGSPTGSNPNMATTNMLYGADDTNSVAYTILLGVACMKAYQALGNPDYIAAADRAAMHLRAMQCADLRSDATTRVVYPAHGSPYHTGGLPYSYQAFSEFGTFAGPTQPIGNGLALWFFNLLAAVRGPSAVYGVASSSDFTADTRATLGTMITELTGFLINGAKDAGVSNAMIAPLSPSTPRREYEVFVASGSGSGRWMLNEGAVPGGQTLSSDQFSQALFALNFIGGQGTTVDAAWRWLMTFTANTKNQVGGSSYNANTGGVYDPTYAVADTLLVRSADGTTALSTEANGALYAWSSSGFMAAIQARLDAGNYIKAKNQLGEPQPRSSVAKFQGPDPSFIYLGQLGRSGLNFQPYTTAATRTQRVDYAAQTALFYRIAANTAYAVPPG